MDIPMPGRVRVGVFAASTGDGALTAHFDNFKLTPLKPPKKKA
jgi:hypothetical protein